MITTSQNIVIAIKLVLTIVCGGAIGFEREYRLLVSELPQLGSDLMTSTHESGD